MPTLTINIVAPGTEYLVDPETGLTQRSTAGHMWYSMDKGDASKERLAM